MQQVVGPDANGNYVVVDEQGNPVGAPFNPLTEFAGLSSSTTPSQGSTTIGPDGKLVRPQSLSAAPPPTQPGEGSVADDIALAYTDTGSPSRSHPASRAFPTNQGAYQEQVSYDPVFGAPPANFGGGGDPFATIPNYLNGQRHPAAGGQPLVPGGIFAQQSDGYDNRQQVSVPGGATAGPFAVRAAPTPSPDYNGGVPRGGDGGGGGGGTSPIYDNLRAKGNALASRLKGYGGGGSDDYVDYDKQYRRQGRRMDRAYDRYNDELADPDPMPVRGWVKEQGFKPGTVDAILADPAGILPNVFPGFEANERTQGIMDLPMTDLAMLTFGTQGRNLLSKTPVVKPPKILRQNGVKPIKPEYKKSLDSSKVANKIAEMYSQIGQDPNHRFTTGELLGNMANADKHSALRQGVEQQARINPGNAFDSIRSYVNSAFDASMDNTGFSSAYKRGIDNELRLLAPQFLSLKPKQADAAVNTIANHFLR